jgi:hypothetical protein
VVNNNGGDKDKTTTVDVAVPVKDGTSTTNAGQQSSDIMNQDSISDLDPDQNRDRRKSDNESNIENGREPDLAAIDRIYRCVRCILNSLR